MEQSKSTELKVGVAVGLGLLLFIATVMGLGGDSIFKSTYTLRVRFDQVQGLGPGSVVQVLGIPVGNVKEISVVTSEKTNNLEVILKIDKAFQKQITEGSIAGVRTQGALGDKFVYIQPGPPSGSSLKNGDLLEAELKGGLLDTLAESGDKIERVFQILEEVYTLMNRINGNGRSERIMRDLTMAADNFNKSSQHLAKVMEKVDGGTGTLGALINDRSVYDGIKRFMGGSQDKFMKSVIRETIQSEPKK